MKRISKVEENYIFNKIYAIKDSCGLYFAKFNNRRLWNDGTQNFYSVNFKVYSGGEAYYGVSYNIETGELFLKDLVHLYELEDKEEFEKLKLTLKLSK